MKSKKLGWKIVPLIIFIFLAFMLGQGLFLEPQLIPSTQIGKPVPNFQLPQLKNPQAMMTPADFNNQVVLFNVWASWCEACNQEQVFLLKLSREGVPIYGLNYKDSNINANQWLEDWGNPYKLIAQDKDGTLAMDLGVYGAPETFLIDKQGVIRYRHVGVLNEQIWNKEILPLKQRLE